MPLSFFPLVQCQPVTLWPPGPFPFPAIPLFDQNKRLFLRPDHAFAWIGAHSYGQKRREAPGPEPRAGQGDSPSRAWRGPTF